MSLQNLTDSSAFTSGSHLWILPDPKMSHWARKIDWYLNFQFARAEGHVAPELDSGLLQLLRDEDLAPPSTSARNETPLMVSSRHRLPSGQTVAIPYRSDFKEWLLTATSIWRDLGYPTLRLFLPVGATVAEAEALWPTSMANTDGVSAVGDNDFQSGVKERT